LISPVSSRVVETIYVGLLEEGIDCWRPVQAEQVASNIYRIADQDIPRDELWEFKPGDLVYCDVYWFSDGMKLRAYSKVVDQRSLNRQLPSC
jgi:hypothetical protein